MRLRTEGFTTIFLFSLLLGPAAILALSSCNYRVVLKNPQKTPSPSLNTDDPTSSVPDAPLAPNVDSLNLSYNNYTKDLDRTPPLTWNEAIDKSGTGINHYEIAIGTSAGGTQIQEWTDIGNITTYQETGLSLTSGETYYVSLRAVDNANNISEASKGGGWKVDNQAPDVSGLNIVNSASGYTSNLTKSTISTWNPADDSLTGGSGIDHYEFAIGTTSGGTQVLGWTNIGNVTSYQQATGLNLTSGTTYYSSVRAVDKAGNTSSISTGPGWLADNQAPDVSGLNVTNVAYTPLLNQSPTSTWSAANDASTGGSGINYYEFAIGTTSGGTQVLGWTNIGNVTSYQRTTGLALTNGTTYYSSLRAVDKAGNTSSISTGPAWLADNQAPDVSGVTLNDGTYSQSLTQSPNLTWNAATAGTGIHHYEIAIGTTTGGTQTLPWTDVGNVTSYQRTGLSLTSGTTYYASLRAVDNASHTSSAVQGDGWLVDNQAPDVSGLNVTQNGYTSSLTQSPTSTWSAANDAATGGSGVNHYEFAIGTTSGGIQVLGWTNIGNVTSYQRTTGLALASGTTYYSSVRAVDNAGNTSSVSTGSGWLVDNQAPDVSGVTLNDGTYSQSLTQSPNLTWNAATDASTGGAGIHHYEIAIGLSPGAVDVLIFTNVGNITSYQRTTGLSLLSGVTYYATLRAVDNAGNTSNTVQGNGWLVDNQAPDVSGLNLTNSMYTSSLTQSPTSTWTSTTDASTGGSGINYYEFAIGTTSGGTQVLSWTNIGNVTSYQRTTGLALSNGTTYYSSVRVVDNAGNTSSTSTGPSWIADNQAPDVSGASVTNSTNYSNSTTASPTITWNAATDISGSGVHHYEIAIGTTAGGTQTLTWTNISNVTSYQRTTGITLTDGTSYYTSIRAVDNASNTSSVATGPAWLVDTLAPDITSTSLSNATYTTLSSQSPTISWAPAPTDSGSGILKYQIAMGTSPGSVNSIVDWTDIGTVTNYTFTGLSMVEGTTYTASLRTVDRASNVSSIKTSGGWIFDLPPTTPTSFSDMNTGSNTESPLMTWSSSTDPGSGIAGYQLALGTSPGATDLVSWTDVGSLTSGKLTGLSLTNGTIYYSSVRSKDNSGNTSIPSQGDGWRAVTQWKSQDSSPASIAGGGVYSSLLQPDNKRILGGDFTSVSYNTGRAYLRKLTTLGGDDLPFDSTVTTGFNGGSVYALARQSDGKILVGGGFTSYNGTSQNRITRLNADGSWDSSFSIGTGFNGTVNAIALQSDGKLLVGGNFGSYNGTSQAYITRLNTDGSWDSSFSIGTGFNGTVNAIALQSDGKLLVGGNFGSYNGTSQRYISRLNTDGSVDSTFSIGTGFSSIVYAIALQSDGKILVGGGFTSYNGTSQNYITRLNTDGSRDSSFSIGTGFNSVVRAIAVQSDGKILVGGIFTIYNGTSQLCITRLNTDGSRDSSFSIGTGVNGTVYAIATQSDGKILAGGYFTTYNGTSQSNITRLNANGSMDSSWIGGGNFNSTIFALTVASDGGVIAGGFFSSTSLGSQSRLTRLGSDGVRDLSFSVGTGFNSFVRSLGLQSDGKIVVGGSFTTYQGLSQNYIVRLASDGSKDSTFSVGSGFDADVNAIAIQSDGKILAGGNFTSYNGTSRTYAARINTDGSLDTTFSLTGTGLNNFVRAIVLQTDGKIILGGDFTTYNGASQPYVIRLNTDGTKDSSFSTTGTGINGSIYTLALQPNGAILAGGTFSQYNGTSRPYLLRLQSDGTLDTSFALTGSGINSDVYSINLQTDGKILVGGNFTSYNGTTQGYMTRLNADGSQDTSFLIKGGGFNGVVRTFSLQTDGKILAGGGFTTYYDTTGSLTYTTLLGW